LHSHRNTKGEQHKSLVTVVFSAIGALLVAGAIYGGGLWGVLVVLRHASVIDSIMSYRNCVFVAYIYVILRSYDNQLFGKK